MTSSVEGLMTSNVLPSTDLTNSLLMNLLEAEYMHHSQLIAGKKLPKNVGSI
jgi:hypothetical protein